MYHQLAELFATYSFEIIATSVCILFIITIAIKRNLKGKNRFNLSGSRAPAPSASAFPSLSPSPSSETTLSEDERLRLKYAEEALKFYENYIRGLAFESETHKRLMDEMCVRNHPISSPYFFRNVVYKDTSISFQLDLVLLTKNHTFVLECKKWSQASAQKDFIDSATIRFGLHSNALYGYLNRNKNKEDKKAVPGLTRIIVLSENTQNINILINGFEQSIREHFYHLQKYYRVTTLQNLPELLLHLSEHNLTPADPALKDVVEKIASYDTVPGIKDKNHCSLTNF